MARDPSGSGAIVLLYTGADNFSRHEALQRHVAELGQEASYNVLRLPQETLTWEALLSAASTPPFFGSRRLVLVEGLLASFDPPSSTTTGGRARRRRGAAAPSLREWAGLPEALEQMPGTTTLIFVEGPLTAGNSLLQLLRPRVSVREFQPLKGEALTSWLQDRARRMGNALSPSAARLLLELAGTDLWTLHHELAKLATYTGGGAISEAAIRLLTADNDVATIYELVNHLLYSRLGPALQILPRLLRSAAPALVLFLLTGQYRQLLRAREVLDAGGGLAQLQATLGLRQDWQAERLARQARRLAREHILAAYDRLQQADVEMKTGRYPGELALELLLVDLASGGLLAGRASAS